MSSDPPTSRQGAESTSEWTTVIQPRGKAFDLRVGELWRYRDLITLFVRRDFVAQYKQTILGPAWHIIQPLLTTIVFTLIFGKVAKLPTDGLPTFLFYMSGTVGWTYFANVITKSSETFIANAAIFGKVYFPRIIMPLSIVISNLLKFGIQFLIFIVFYVVYYLQGAAVSLNSSAVFFPLPGDFNFLLAEPSSSNQTRSCMSDMSRW